MGKSSLLRQFSHKMFDDTLTSTIGVDLESKKVNVFPNTSVILQIWDTAGQEAYYSITRNYYVNAAGAVIVFELGDRSSFLHAVQWINEIRTNNPECTLILVGNKSDKDLSSVENRTLLSEVQAYSRKEDVVLMTTSAKKYDDCEKVFTVLATALFQNNSPCSFVQLPTSRTITYSRQELTQFEDCISKQSRPKKKCCS